MKVVYLARGRSVDGDGYRDAGLFASRGKLGDSADDEMWVDEALFIVMAEARLGVSMARLRQLYGGGRKGGPIPGALRAERAAVDSKLAELDNLALLSEHVGIPQTTLRDAAKRGRERNAG